MSLKIMINIYSCVLCVISIGAFYRDEKTIGEKYDYLIKCSEKVEDKMKCNEDVFTVVPKDVSFESFKEEESTYYTLKTKIKLCFIDEKIIKIERIYYNSTF